jgi:hypothetical protein
VTGEGITRVPMNLPGSQHVIHVADENVDGYLDLGWKKVRVRHANTDTGTTPTQRNER